MRAEVKDVNIAAVPSGVDDAVGVPSDKWFVAIVNPRHEKSVATRLSELGVDCYVATQEELHIWKNGRRKKIDRVVIPSIVFVRCTEKKRREIVGHSYILRFMVNRSSGTGTLQRPVAVIPDWQISRLRFMLGYADTPVDFSQVRFKINDTVRVIRGHLMGMEGEILTEPDGSHKLAISISQLGCATVHIDPQDVELI